MNLAPQQQSALDAVAKWHKSGSSPLFRLFGYAGTGKTTLAKYFAESLDCNVRYAAFTGKAAHVMQKKGCTGASTIHKLIYKVAPSGMQRLQQLTEEVSKLEKDTPVNTKLLEVKREELKREVNHVKQPRFTVNPDSEIRHAGLVIIDECSMVGGKMATDLLSFGVPILALGDPAQLPPVNSEGYFIGKAPDFLLTEVHRQAADNPIIHLATRVRNGERLSLGRYGDSEVTTMRNVHVDRLCAADQVIVGRNVTRRKFNVNYRRRKNFESQFPLQGDKLVCLRNNGENGLLNGSQWTVVSCDVGSVLTLDIESEDSRIVTEAHCDPFKGHDVPLFKREEADEFDYGYALTCHKSQGSQWDDVCIFDESRDFNQPQKWLYTAITRAAEKVTVVI